MIPQKPKVKLMGLQSSIRQGSHTTTTTSIINSKINSAINKSQKMEEESQPSSFSSVKDMNVKRRMNADEDYCTTE